MAAVPSPEVRAAIAAKLNDLIEVVESNPQFGPTAASASLFHIWEFARLTEYMLSEVDGIRQQGYQFKHAGQIKITAAEELFNDTFTRSATLDQLTNGPPMMRAMMGMGEEIAPEIQAAAKAVLEAFR